MKPTIGRIVIWRSPAGQDSPAIVAATHDSIVKRDAVTDRGWQLDSETHVNLAIVRIDGAMESARNVPEAPQGEIRPGTWRWPERV